MARQEAKKKEPQEAHTLLVASSGILQEGNNSLTSLFGTQLQELVIRAMVQSTAALVSPAAVLGPHAAVHGTTLLGVEVGEPGAPSTWNELAFRKTEAKRKKKPDMMRTSAGEESDSQEDFPIQIENATSEQ